MILRRRTGLIALACWIAAAGCESVDADRPPRIRYGAEMCASCGMLISEERFAASLTTASGEVRNFDELGCLIRYRTGHPEPIRHIWVHDYQRSGWLEASAAFFVHSRELATAMGSGLVALAMKDDAVRLASETHGEVVQFEALPSLVQTQPAGEPSAAVPANLDTPP